jgi:hypothetical protein
MGSLLYGAYIARRFWQYTGAPVTQATQQFVQEQGALDPLLTGEIPTGGVGALAGLQGRGQTALGAAGYRLYGGLLGGSAQALQTPAVADVAAGAGIFGGAALGGRILGGALGSTALAGAGTAAGIAGLGYVGLSLGAGAYRRQTGRDITPLQMPLIAAQTLHRAGAGAVIAGGGVAAGALGLGEQYAGAVGQYMQTGVGGLLTQEIDRGQDAVAGFTREDIQTATQQLGTTEAELTPLIGGAYSVTGERGLTPRNMRVLQSLNRLMRTEGLSAAGAVSAFGGYPEALGYLPGDQGFDVAGVTFEGMNAGERARAMQGAQRRAGLAGQFRQVVSRQQISGPQLRSMMDAFGTQQQGQIGFGGFAALTGAGAGPTRAGLAVMGMAGRVTQGHITQNQMAQGVGMMADIAPYVPQAALNAPGVMAGAMQGFAQLDPSQANIVGQIWGGNLGAMSYAANTGMLPSGMAMTDISGRAMYETNLGQGLGNLFNVAQAYGGGMGGGALADLSGFQGLNRFVQGQNVVAAGGGTAGQAMRGGLAAIGGLSQRFMNFFGENPDAGLLDYQQAHSDRMYGYQQAGIGIGQQRIDLQRQFLYGGQDWRNPDPGSLWGIQDRMRSLQWQGQQASFAFSLESMDVGNRFAQRQEDISGRRMGVTQDYQRWGLGFQRAGMDLSRQFTMENRQFQDQLRGMQTSFTMEDFDENIRLSSGRQRRNLVQQRERFVSVQNVQDEQIERQREQQEELWAREDEQFEKRREYTEELIALDEEQYNLNVERRETLYDMNREDLERRIELAEKLHELEDEQIEKQREFTVAQLDLQEKALGIQAAAAAAQKEYNDDMRELMQEVIDPVAGFIKESAKYDTVANILIGLQASIEALDAMGEDGPDALRKMAEAITNVSTSKIMAVLREIEAVGD